MLINYNNLREFITVKNLNGRQARWAIFLAVYNFDIKYRPKTTNSTNISSRRPNYEGDKTAFNKLLSILKRKLVNINSIAFS